MKIQHKFINEIVANNIPVSVYLKNGVQLQGMIENFDDQTIVLTNNYPQLIFFHAISSIMPKKY